MHPRGGRTLHRSQAWPVRADPPLFFFCEAPPAHVSHGCRQSRGVAGEDIPSPSSSPTRFIVARGAGDLRARVVMAGKYRVGRPNHPDLCNVAVILHHARASTRISASVRAHQHSVVCTGCEWVFVSRESAPPTSLKSEELLHTTREAARASLAQRAKSADSITPQVQIAFTDLRRTIEIPREDPRIADKDSH